MAHLPTPPFDRAADWVGQHLGHLVCDPGTPAEPARRGGQRAADSALASLDIAGYAKRRSQVHPAPSRGATVLSPYIRYGLISLAEATAAVADAPA
ncbi:MAG: deoxyribodipyrimidine photolyase, partial [Actinobacteria bacterium]|nr:deoxyribodipyrimidine photolyase [Actinomycetota bacterium]